jgi:hypothetical protein
MMKTSEELFEESYQFRLFLLATVPISYGKSAGMSADFAQMAGIGRGQHSFLLIKPQTLVPFEARQ